MAQNNSQTDPLVLTILIIGMAFLAVALFNIGRNEANIARELVTMSC